MSRATRGRSVDGRAMGRVASAEPDEDRCRSPRALIRRSALPISRRKCAA
jgi:hypothetical protein